VAGLAEGGGDAAVCKCGAAGLEVVQVGAGLEENRRAFGGSAPFTDDLGPGAAGPNREGDTAACPTAGRISCLRPAAVTSLPDLQVLTHKANAREV